MCEETLVIFLCLFSVDAEDLTLGTKYLLDQGYLWCQCFFSIYVKMKIQYMLTNYLKSKATFYLVELPSYCGKLVISGERVVGVSERDAAVMLMGEDGWLHSTAAAASPPCDAENGTPEGAKGILQHL